MLGATRRDATTLALLNIIGGVVSFSFCSLDPQNDLNSLPQFSSDTAVEIDFQPTHGI
jgi:hypothetical protein